MRLGVVLLSLFFAACAKSAPAEPPAVTLAHALILLDYNGWKLMDQPPAEGESFGCIEAGRNGEHGRVCFLDCEGRSVDEIGLTMGSSFGYQVGSTEACTSFTTFSGSPKLRQEVAGEKHMSPHTRIPR
jgi:hypothetical protein